MVCVKYEADKLQTINLFSCKGTSHDRLRKSANRDSDHHGLCFTDRLQGNMSKLEQYYRAKGRDLVDKSNVDEEALYRCQDEDCRKVSKGNTLLPIIVRNLKEVDGKVVQAEGFTCYCRKCPHCRGSMKLETGLDGMNGLCSLGS